MNAREAGLALAIFCISGLTALADVPVRLLCEHPRPVGPEVSQRYLLEIDLNKKSVRSTQFVNGKAMTVIPFEIMAVNENLVYGVRTTNNRSQVTEEVTLNRLTAEAQFSVLFYGNARDELWNEQKKRMGGFEQDPVRMNGNGLQCRPALQQF